MKELVFVAETSDLVVVEWVDQARSALQSARDNFERIRIRDQAKAVEKAAGVLGRRDIQVQASVLVQEAERVIAKANPPMSRQESGARKGKKVVTQNDDLISQTNLRNIRQAHGSIDDLEFEEIVEQATDEGVPLTRRALVDVGKQKRRKEAREERDTKLSAQETLFPTGQLYTVLLADPPWRYSFAETENREIENHYPTMALDEIKGLDVPSLCYSDSVLYL